MARQIRKVVVLGANGAMGAGSGEVFAAAGIETTFLARTRDKAIEGQRRAEKLAKSSAISRFIRTGSYDEDLARAVGEADLVFEAVSEDLALKRVYFEQVDKLRKPDAIVATVSSGLSIATMAPVAATASRALPRHPLLQSAERDRRLRADSARGHRRSVVADVTELLDERLGRELVAPATRRRSAATASASRC